MLPVPMGLPLSRQSVRPFLRHLASVLFLLNDSLHEIPFREVVGEALSLTFVIIIILHEISFGELVLLANDRGSDKRDGKWSGSVLSGSRITSDSARLSALRLTCAKMMRHK